ncbi:PilZ domain-containing protein [Desulfovibrio aminophilus]|uniref:PilZ domain-containing protein n=1 Tax=Desulfovibrio aminophilus TaxID=81425 RepID=UPI00339A8F93
MDENRRRRTRVRTGHEAVLTVGGEDRPVRTLDLSLKGAQTTPLPGIVPGLQCRFRIDLAQDVVIEAEARVARSDADGLALEFTSVNEDGFPHLLRLVQLHYGDADAIERELSTPAFEP